jgi:hypothetical protein
MVNTATAANRPRYSESTHVLLTRRTRAVILGMAMARAAAAGVERAREGELIRELLDNALDDMEREMSKRAYAEALAVGEAELVRRETEARTAAALKSA